MKSKRFLELESKLKANQIKAAYLMVENELRETGDKKTMEEIAEEVGVHYKTTWEWRTKNKVFIEYKNAIADDFLSDKRALVYGQLMKLITSPNPSVKAISLFLQNQGLLTNKTQIETIGGASESTSNESIEKDLAELDAILNDDTNEDF